MPSTFSSATPAYLGGNKLIVEFTLRTADTLDGATKTTTILMQDLSSSAAPFLIRLEKSDIMDGMNEVDGARMTKNTDGSKLTVTLSPVFNGVKSKKVKVTAIENQVSANGTASEQYLITEANSTVTIVAVPSAPALSLFKPLKFSINAAGTGALVAAGVARVAITPKEGVTNVKLFAKGTLANGDAFAKEFTPVAVTTTDAKYADVPITGLEPLAHEQPLHFFAISENSHGESDCSDQLHAIPSLRVAAPKLSSVRSLEDRKLIVQGSLPALPQGSATSYVSIILKLKSDHDVNNPLRNWKTSDQMNLQFTSSSTSAAFKKEVKMIRGAAANGNLLNGCAYMVAAIHHTAVITDSDNHPLDPESPTEAPTLTQSLSSNVLAGTCCQHLDETVDLNVDSQSSSLPADAEQYVMFAPAIANVGTLTGLPLTVKFGFTASGVKKTQYNDIGEFTFPVAPFYKVKNPVKGARYLVEVEFHQALSEDAAASIAGDPALNLLERDNIKYAVVAKFEKEVEQTPSSDDVPALLNLHADYSNAAGRKVLYSMHKLPAASAYTAQGLLLVSQEYQAMLGLAGDNSDASFVTKHKLTSAGATNLVVTAVAPNNATGSNYGDLPELKHITLYNTAGNVVDPAIGFHTIRVRSRVRVLKSNIEFNGQWQTAIVEVKSLKLPSPSTVSVTQALDLTSDPSSSRLKVTHVSVAAADIIGYPQGWLGGRVYGYETKLVDSDGNDVEGASANKPFTEVELSDATAAGVVTSSHIFALRTSEGQIYSARARTHYQRLNASGEPMADKAYGDWSGSNTWLIKGKLSITSAVVTTSPVSLNPSGRDPTGMDSITVGVGLNMGQMSSANASITVFMKGRTAAGADQTVWTMGGAQYNATKKLYVLTVVADPTADYSQTIFVHAAHSDFSNADAKAL